MLSKAKSEEPKASQNGEQDNERNAIWQEELRKMQRCTWVFLRLHLTSTPQPKEHQQAWGLHSFWTDTTCAVQPACAGRFYDEYVNTIETFLSGSPIVYDKAIII